VPANSRGRTLVVIGLALACGAWAGAAPAAGVGAPDPALLAARAREIRVERKEWDEEDALVRTATAAQPSRAWLVRLMGAAAGETRRWPDSLCAVACRRCPDQLQAEVTFRVDDDRWLMSLYLREGLMFLRSDRAAGWSFADSAGAVLGLLREALPKDGFLPGWSPPPARPAPLDPASGAYREDDLLVTGLPEATTRVPPNYPARARDQGISGVVQAEALVEADGTVGHVRVRKSVPGLDGAALEAVKAWRFRPATCGGRPVPVWVTVPVRFSLR
jgi:TonB family protein